MQLPLMAQSSAVIPVESTAEAIRAHQQYCGRMWWRRTRREHQWGEGHSWQG